MKILAIVEDLRINATSAGICNSNILNSLLLHDNEIDCLYDYAESETFSWLNNSKISFERINLHKLNVVQRFILKIPKINSVSAYLTGFVFEQNQKIASWEKSIKKKLRANDHDFILVLGAGNSMLNYFAISNINTKVPYIVNYHDPYPMSQYPEPYKSQDSWVSKINIKKSNKVIEKAFKVSFPSQRLFEWMLHFHPNLKGKEIILPHPNGKLLHLTSLKDDDIFNLNTNKFNIIHLGSLLGHRNPTFLINAFIKFLDSDVEKKQNSVLNIIGTISKNNSYFDLENNLKSDNLNIVKQRISYNKSLSLLNDANVTLIIEAVADESPFMPGKLTDYISVNKPIMALTPQKSEVSRLLGENYKYKTDVNNEDEILMILNLLYDNWQKNISQTLDRKDLHEYVSAFRYNLKLTQNIK